MENMVLLLLCFGGGLAGVAAAYLFGDAHDTYSKEKAMIDMLRAAPSAKFNPYEKPRCDYCWCMVSAMTDRCAHCGAPHG